MTCWRASSFSVPLGIVLALMLPGVSEAGDIYSQTVDAATTTDATLAFFKIPSGTSASSGVKYIDLIASANAAGHAFEVVVICRRFPNYTGTCPEMPDFSIKSDSTALTKIPTLYHVPFTLGSTTPLDGSRYYAFGINRTSGDAAGINLRGVTTTNTCIIAGCGISGTPYVVLSDGEEEEGIDPVIIIPGILGSEENSDGEWVIDPILHTYDDLIATLDVNYYTPDVDLFTFPYNWRKSNVETAVLLKEKIDAVKAICNCDKVDLVAHSMGGLVARQYIQSDAYEQDVDQLIFLGTPHLGAPKAYLMWEGGTTGFDWQDAPLNFILKQEAEEAGFFDVVAYVRTTPISSVRQLLPIYDYIFDASDLRDYPFNYPANQFLEDLNDKVDSLKNSGVRMYNFVGETGILATAVGINVVQSAESPPVWEHGEPEMDNPFVIGAGDGTVPKPSATFIDENIAIKDTGHRILPTAAQAEIFQILTGNAPSEVITDNHDNVNFKLLFIKMLSPADLQVIAPDGKKIGKENGQSINQIPGAFYTGFNTDTEFITILNPLDGEYRVIAQGTGSGPYTVETNYVSKATTTEASFAAMTAPGKLTELTLKVSNTNPEDLEFITLDLEPPTITITSPLAKDYLRSEQLSVHVSATDAVSGVSGIETRLDGSVISNTSMIDLFYMTLGNHGVVASSTDGAGNASTSSRTFRIVVNATSTISDIERTYNLGWTTKKVRDEFTKKLNSCNIKKTTVTNVTKTVVVTGRNGKPATQKVNEKVTKVEIVFDKNCAKAMLKELDKYKNKGLNTQAHQLLKEDIQWLINN